MHDRLRCDWWDEGCSTPAAWLVGGRCRCCGGCGTTALVCSDHVDAAAIDAVRPTDVLEVESLSSLTTAELLDVVSMERFLDVWEEVIDR